MNSNRLYLKYIKSYLDTIIALLLLVGVLPLIAIIALMLAVHLKGKILFKQNRVGKDGSIFQIYKFKTMLDLFDQDGKPLPDAVRLTPIGKFLRKTSLDELPQLINILKGDMSLVGPRPLLPKYLPLYNEFQSRRHEVKPGITGWTQVNGRNALSWEEKFELDVWYVDHVSFALDMKILMLTLVKVIKREGIYQQGQVTVEAFRGNKSN